MHRMIRILRPLGLCLLLALAVASTPVGVHAQPPATSEVILPVGTTGSIPNQFGAKAKTLKVIPGIIQADFSFDFKAIQIQGLAPGFGQIQVLDAMNNILQVVNVQVTPPDLEIPFGDSKVFPALPGTTIEDIRGIAPEIIKAAVAPNKKKVEITAVGLGSAKVTLIDNKGGFTTYNIIVVPSEKYLQFKIRQAVPTATVYPVQVNKGVFMLNGTVERGEDIPAVLATAEGLSVKVINGLRVNGVMQVQLEVVVAEVSRTELREMSFQFFNSGRVHFLASTFGPATAAAATAISPHGTATNLSGTSNLLLGFVNDKQSFFGFLEALRNEGLAKILTCPKVVTLSGKPAQFLSGGELAVPEPSGLGTNAVIFKDFGTRLNFLPIVLGNGRIFIEVEPSVTNRNDALGTVIAGTAVPGFDKQFLHASVEIEAGQTFALGGMTQHAVNATTSKVPILGDAPFLGTAFRTVSYNQIETELLILVTPYLVDPMACSQLPKYVPGQETRIPDDFELFLEGILEAPRGQRRVFPDGIHYQAAYLNGPSAAVFPCGLGNGNGNGYGGTGSCGAGGCATNGNGGIGGHGNGASQLPKATPIMPPAATAPAGAKAAMPTGYFADPMQYPGSGQTLAPRNGIVGEPGETLLDPGYALPMPVAPMPGGVN
jgi:pilus assembly protein CpaC